MKFQETVHEKMAIYNSIHENINLVKNVEDVLAFLTRKVFNSDNFSILSNKQEILKLEKPQMKMKSETKQKHGNLFYA